MKQKKQSKRKVLLSLDEDVIKLLDEESKERGVNKSQLVTMLLKDNTENRLSKHIARDIENLLLYLILQNENLKDIKKEELLNNLNNIYKNTKTIKTIKSIFLKETREKKNKEISNFWNEVLTILNPENFKEKIKTNGKFDYKKTLKFIMDLYTLIDENKKLWNK